VPDRVIADKGVGRKIPGGRCQRKKDRKIALLSLFQRGATEKTKNSKKIPKNSTIKPLSTISVLCMKIKGVTAPLPPAADANVCKQ